MGRGWNLLFISCGGENNLYARASTTMQQLAAEGRVVGETNRHEFILTTIWGSFPHSFHQVVVSNEQTQGYPTRPGAHPV